MFIFLKIRQWPLPSRWVMQFSMFFVLGLNLASLFKKVQIINISGFVDHEAKSRLLYSCLYITWEKTNLHTYFIHEIKNLFMNTKIAFHMIFMCHEIFFNFLPEPLKNIKTGLSLWFYENRLVEVDGWSYRGGRFGCSRLKTVLGNTKSINLSFYLYKGNKTYYQISLS